MRALFGVVATLASLVTSAYVVEHRPGTPTIVSPHGVDKATALGLTTRMAGCPIHEKRW